MKQKFAVIGFSYFAGLYFATLLPEVWGLCLCGAMLVSSVVVYALKRYTAGVYVFVIGAGIGVYALYSLLFVVPVQQCDGQEVTLSGTVIEKSVPTNDTARYTVSVGIGGVPAKIVFYAQDADAAYGDSITFDAVLYKPESITDFDEREYLLSRGIVMKAAVNDGIEIGKTDTFSLNTVINDFSNYIGERIMTFLPGGEGALLKAMFLGDRSSLSEEMKTSIRRAGMSHTTAVSGLHLTLVSHIFMLILGLCGLKNKRKLRFALLIVLILFFMVFFRMSVSVLRSGIMLIIFYSAELFGRKGSTLNSIGLALLIILVVSPYACRDTGLILSVSGTFGVGVVAPSLTKRLRENRAKPLLEAVVGTLCACYCTLPFSVLYFGGVSLVSVISNIVVLPFFYVALSCVLFFTICLGNGSFFMLIAGVMSKYILAIITFLGGFEYSYISLDYDFVPAFIFAACVFVTVVRLCLRSTSKTVFSAVATVIMFCVMIFYDNVMFSRNINVSAYSDGSNGAVYISDGDTHIVLATDMNYDILDNINEYRSRRFTGALDMLIVCETHSNALQLADGIASELTVLPTDQIGIVYKVNDNITVTRTDEYLLVDISGTKITVGSVKNDLPESDITFFTGYKKSASDKSGRILYFSRRQKIGGINIYYDGFSTILSR